MRELQLASWLLELMPRLYGAQRSAADYPSIEAARIRLS